MEIAPTYLKSEYIKRIANTLNSAKFHTNKIILNLNNLNFSSPIGILSIGATLRDFLNYRNINFLETEVLPITAKTAAISYLKHIGFFQHIGVYSDSNSGTATGSSTYIPIERISKEDFSNTEEILQNLIQEKSQSLSNILLGVKSNTERDSSLIISYSIREILRNVFEHSESNECFVCAQRWQDGKAEIAIADNGIGIFNTLSKAYRITEDEAISEAIKPGVTRTSVLSDDENIHQNSGYGLYAISEIGRSFGEFHIGSGTKIYSSTNNSKVESSIFNGTFVGLKINNIPTNFNDLLQDIIKTGEDEAQKEGRASKASNASKLAEYFKKN